MKLCKDCRHCEGDPADPYCGVAPKPRAQEFDPVTGERIALQKQYFACRIERVGYCDTDCGPDGQHFEPRVEAFSV